MKNKYYMSDLPVIKLIFRSLVIFGNDEKNYVTKVYTIQATVFNIMDH
jgi:hypothetical protein